MTNRGNDRRRIFHDESDYRAFLHLLEFAKQRYPVKVIGLCQMPNHFHGLFQPQAENALSAYLQWVSGRYACDLRAWTGTTGYGHIFQSRFWSDDIKDVRHCLSVLRYIEANPVVAGLVAHAEEWPWSSLAMRASKKRTLLDPLPFELPREWSALVNSKQPNEETERIEHPARRGRPALSTSAWVEA